MPSACRHPSLTQKPALSTSCYTIAAPHLSSCPSAESAVPRRGVAAGGAAPSSSSSSEEDSPGDSRSAGSTNCSSALASSCAVPQHLHSCTCQRTVNWLCTAERPPSGSCSIVSAAQSRPRHSIEARRARIAVRCRSHRSAIVVSEVAIGLARPAAGRCRRRVVGLRRRAAAAAGCGGGRPVLVTSCR